ncbi:uncharacterized protein [Clytia hemisphaerica]|uniref:Uncharacterized protein n=1 Tax=Clytia hemisphaerica TaxID=252671 RepID=A0A7M5TYH1_9CNID|eukprot:TCONS_00010861-protein
MAEEREYTLICENGDDLVERTIKSSNMNIEIIGLAFKLVPSSIYLVERYGSNKTEFPSKVDGTFKLRENETTHFTVEGEKKNSNSTGASNQLPGLPTPFQQQLSEPFRRVGGRNSLPGRFSVSSTSTSRQRKRTQDYVKVTASKRNNGKKKFQARKIVHNTLVSKTNAP